MTLQRFWRAWKAVPGKQRNAITSLAGVAAVLSALGLGDLYVRYNRAQVLSTAVPREQASATPTAAAVPERGAGTVQGAIYRDTPDYVPPPGHPQMTRDEQIRALQASDPSSHGYTDADRDFLREHGVTEAQARAIEETLARQGVE